MICSAARSCAASYAAAMSGCSAAASDQVFGPLTTTSTNRTACVVVAQLPPRLAGVRVAAGDPGLVAVAGQRRQLGHAPVGGGEAAGEPGALGQVVVIGPAAVGLHVVPGGGRRAGVHLHSAVHFQRHPTMTNTVTPRNADGPREAGPELPPKVACVPSFWRPAGSD